MNRIMIAGVLAMSVGVAAVNSWGADAPTTAPAASQPALDPDGPVAMIAGRPINRKLFDDLLVQVAGMRVFEQVLDLVLVNQACQQVGIPLEGEDYQNRVKAELARELANLGPSVPDAQRSQVLESVLRQKGITDVEFGLLMQRNAGLRALAKASGTLAITPGELNSAYEAQYGEKADVILIPVKSVVQAAAIRDAVENKNRDPMMAAQENGSQAQAITISKNADQVKTVRDTVWQMKEKSLSPTVQQGDSQYVIYLVKMTPSQMATVKFDSVKAKLTDEVMNMKETSWMNQHMLNLRRIAVAQNQIQINDPELHREYQNMSDQIRKQQEAAATQNATQPGMTSATQGK